LGSGGDVALGAMEALAVGEITTPSEAETVVRRAIEIAIKHDIYCAAPVRIFTQYSSGKVIECKV
jgi:ATP-dependent protease HslVU (ClpYQ) peptidase subunit